jgi:chaperone required for assembly of F1-ATPase
MAAPTQTLIDAIALEWQAQDNTIVPETMPLTQLLTTAIDRRHLRADITAALTHYVDSDLLCYLADAPVELREEQTKIWAPWRLWFQQTYGHALETTFALIRLDQNQGVHKVIRDAIDAMDMHRFTVLHAATSVTGSIVVGLALTGRAISADDAWRCTLCEELFYERTHDLERHGLDPIEEKRRHGMHRDLEACVTYLSLI